MICDYHLHSSFSGDSDTPPEDMIRQAVGMGMKEMCFTDHYDLDYPDEEECFLFDIEQYFQTLSALREKYNTKIKIRIGVELGLQKHLAASCQDIVKSWPFDFVIGSSHVVNHMDPYYPAFFEGRSEEEGYREYFQSILDNLSVFQNFDVYGHIDYVVRYGPNKSRFYSYEKYKDLLDEILKTCIQHGIGLELNTGGLARGLEYPHPHPDIIRRYRQLGGEILTIGSDAHQPKRLGYAFDTARNLLKECGFSYYTIFENRKPVFIQL